jgi:hypothetical protein
LLHAVVLSPALGLLQDGLPEGRISGAWKEKQQSREEKVIEPLLVFHIE